MSDPRMIPADEAKALLSATGLHGCELEHFASYDPEEKYPSGARSLVYIDGWEDVDGLGNYQQTGGPICDGVPEEVAPLFAAAPDLAHTVIEQADRIDQLDHELTNVAAHSLAQGRKLRRHEITLGRVQKAAYLLDQMAGDNGRLADSFSDEYAKGKHDAYARAAELIREALGDTDG